MAFLELNPGKRQRIWGWPAIVNLTLGGTGAGLCMLVTLFASFSHPWRHLNSFVSLPLLAGLIVGCGFLTLTLEAGRPMRGYRLFSRLSESWMSIESLSGLIFILAAVVSHWFPVFFLRALAVVSAMVLSVSQGMMLYRAVGVKSWHQGLVPVLFLTSGLMTAAGVLLLAVGNIPISDRLPMLLLLFIIVVNLALWILFLYGNTEVSANRGIKFLRRPALLLIIAGIGHLLPVLYLGVVFISGSIEPSSVTASFYRVGSGMMLLGGGACQKIGMVIAAGFFRPILIDSACTDNQSMPVS